MGVRGYKIDIMSTHPNNIVNSIHANGYSINKNGGVYRRGKSKWNILAQRLKHLPIGREGPCTNRVAHAAVMLMNAFTRDDVDGCFKKCGYIECVIS